MALPLRGSALRAHGRSTLVPSSPPLGPARSSSDLSGEAAGHLSGADSGGAGSSAVSALSTATYEHALQVVWPLVA